MLTIKDFKIGDKVKMSPEWLEGVKELLGEDAVTEKDLKTTGVVYKVGDEYDICFEIGVYWDYDSFEDVSPKNLIKIEK